MNKNDDDNYDGDDLQHLYGAIFPLKTFKGTDSFNVLC